MIDDLLDASRAETGKLIVERSAISILDVMAPKPFFRSRSITRTFFPSTTRFYAGPTRSAELRRRPLQFSYKPYAFPTRKPVSVRLKGLSCDDSGIYEVFRITLFPQQYQRLMGL